MVIDRGKSVTKERQSCTTLLDAESCGIFFFISFRAFIFLKKFVAIKKKTKKQNKTQKKVRIFKIIITASCEPSAITTTTTNIREQQQLRKKKYEKKMT